MCVTSVDFRTPKKPLLVQRKGLPALVVNGQASKIAVAYLLRPFPSPLLLLQPAIPPRPNAASAILQGSGTV